MVTPTDLPHKQLLIDPYQMGVLLVIYLASNNVTITNPEKQIIDRIEFIVEADFENLPWKRNTILHKPMASVSMFRIIRERVYRNTGHLGLI